MTINWTGTKGLSNVRSLEEEELNLSTFALFWTFRQVQSLGASNVAKIQEFINSAVIFFFLDNS